MAYLSLQLSLQLAPKTNFSLRAINYTQNGAPYQNTKSGGPLILEIPLEKIRRPLSRTRANDPVKVKDLMESIQEIGLQEPVSRVVTGLKLTNGLDLQAYVVKFGVALKKLSGITCVNSNANSNYISN
ncbi:sulfiredoxin, chloroplastic/mitochondrial isoform X3 [Amborella trichopoda]|uniref:sulfiredoxin, chloroplastic/mitochondrial isoform X3 n=1 Tax=Amborella trichopoda TaxID=13333 RepID=UPI0009BFDABB|nr:sulfiredoxin, chloroplastic/mitochondrial isoform X3 [Amborella trichopoda]|eukprot:XP_020531509.1 sulfiredoxin, chloroplastic/mitochondrial isoform X3 [Amborella trichopoda]